MSMTLRSLFLSISFARLDLERIDVIERCDAHLLLELRFEARRGQRALERDVVYADTGRQMLINELQRLQNISRHQPVANAAIIRIQVKIRRDKIQKRGIAAQAIALTPGAQSLPSLLQQLQILRINLHHALAALLDPQNTLTLPCTVHRPQSRSSADFPVSL